MNNDMSHLHFVRPTLLKVVKAHTALGEHDQAILEARKHVDNEETVEGLHALGDAQLAGDKFDEAVQTFSKAFEIAVSGLMIYLNWIGANTFGLLLCRSHCWTSPHLGISFHFASTSLARRSKETMSTKSRRGKSRIETKQRKELLQNPRSCTECKVEGHQKVVSRTSSPMAPR